jgi:hypothetical protein
VATTGIHDRKETGRLDSQAVGPASSADVLYLRRFCAADETSTSAAIREAVAHLDTQLAGRQQRPERLIVIYRNIHPETMTLDIGMPIDGAVELPPASEFHLDVKPQEPAAQTIAEAGFPGLIEARDRLLELGHQPGTSPVFWQIFDAEGFRPWTGHPKAPLYLSSTSIR